LSDEFIGRGEDRAVEILCKLFPDYEVLQQVHIKDLIQKSDFNNLGPQHNKHKHDIVLKKGEEYIVIEVNYKHGEVAEYKWNNVYKPLLTFEGHQTATIEDGECKHLFQLRNGIHSDIWLDYIDVIEALRLNGIEEPEA